MAYARKKGDQVVIVHGRRDPETKKVQQHTLFVLYSKAEAHAALGESRSWFRQSLQEQFPAIRFDWQKLETGIKEQMQVLPDRYSCRRERVDQGFRSAMVEFTRELLVTDPQWLISSSRLLLDQRHELVYLRDLIDWRLECADQEEDEWNRDDPFYWRTLMNRRDVPPEGRERLETLYLEGKHEQAEALAKLLIECWSNYADGYNTLGLISMDRENFEAAQIHFSKAMDVGRALFPKRIAKRDYWSDHSTRPYIRAITYSVQAHNRMGDYSTALTLCQRLQRECDQDITAASSRIPIFLNSGNWKEAAKAARYVHNLFPEENLSLALALHEMGQVSLARVHFLNGAIRYPRAAEIVCGLGKRANPKGYSEVSDHNHGVYMIRDIEHYLQEKKNTGRRAFRKILGLPEVKALLEEGEAARKRWSEERSRDRKWFDRIRELESIEFAESQAAGIWPDAYLAVEK